MEDAEEKSGDESECDNFTAQRKTGNSINHPCKKSEFDKFYHYNKPSKPRASLVAIIKKFLTTQKCNPKSIVTSTFPISKWLTNYNWKEDAVHDVIAGFTVAIMHIPQGMAYAMLGGVPPIVGIYMAFFPVLIYVLMGTSRHVSQGTFAVICMMTSKSVLMYSDFKPGEDSFNSSIIHISRNSTENELVMNNSFNSSGYNPIEVATAVCLTVGLWQLALGICRLGILSVLLSESLISGFTTGAAIHVLTTQIVNLLGIKIHRYSGPLKIVYMYVDIFSLIMTANPAAIIISVTSISCLALYNELLKPKLSRKCFIPFPIELFVIISGTCLSMFLNLEEQYDIIVVGDIPTGLPEPKIPPIQLMPVLIVDALIIAIVIFSVNLSMASIFAKKLNYTIDANQELIAAGCSNIFGSFFSCIPFSASLSRSLIQQTVGGRTQLASVVSCSFLLVVLLVVGPFFKPLPNCILASIVVVALKGMFLQFNDLPAAWRQSRLDGIVWITTFLGVVLIDIDYGLGIGVGVSILSVVIMSQQPSVHLLGHVPDSCLYLNLDYYQAATEISGTKIIQISGGIHFANKEHIRRKILSLIENCDSSKKKINSVILDMTSICFVDPSALKIFISIYKDLEKKSILLCLADCSAAVCNRMEHCDFFSEFPEAQVFPTVHDSVMFSNQQKNNKNNFIKTVL